MFLSVSDRRERATGNPLGNISMSPLVVSFLFLLSFSLLLREKGGRARKRKGLILRAATMSHIYRYAPDDKDDSMVGPPCLKIRLVTYRARQQAFTIRMCSRKEGI